MQAFGQDIVEFLKSPFARDLDMLHLFLLVGIVLIFIVGWLMILNHIHIAAMGA